MPPPTKPAAISIRHAGDYSANEMTLPQPSPTIAIPRRVAILGVGLLGGSVALAIRRRAADVQIVGYARRNETRQLAIDLGVIDVAAESIESACFDCDIIVAAAPVDKIAAMVNTAAKAGRDDCLITDVGSTKATIVAEITHRNFVAAHPIAGSEKTGVENATASLFDNKTIVLTPSDITDQDSLAHCEAFWRLTGGHTTQMSADEHDAHLAAVSHVPHLMSSLIARLTPNAAAELVGSGWRDITRVAAGDPILWTAICRENRAAILQQLNLLSQDISNLRDMLDRCDDDGVHRWLTDAQTIKQNVD